MTVKHKALLAQVICAAGAAQKRTADAESPAAAKDWELERLITELEDVALARFFHDREDGVALLAGIGARMTQALEKNRN